MATCLNPIDSGKTISLLAHKKSNSDFIGWSGEGCSGTNSCTVLMNAAKNITATFSTYTINIIKSGSGANTGKVVGAISGTTNNIIDCGTTCSAQVGGSVGLSVIKDPPRSTFVGWDGGGCYGTDSCYMPNGGDVTATFDDPTLPFPTYTITVNVVGNGTVSSGPGGGSCAGMGCVYSSIKSGATVKLSALTNTDLVTVNWIGCNDVTKDNKCIVTMTKNKDITATFTKTSTLTVHVNVGVDDTKMNPRPHVYSDTNDSRYARIWNCVSNFTANSPSSKCQTPDTTDPGKTPITLFALGTTRTNPPLMLASWSGVTCIEKSQTGQQCTVDMTGEQQDVTATFMPAYTLTINKAGTGKEGSIIIHSDFYGCITPPIFALLLIIG